MPLSSKGATELVELAARAVHGEHVAVAVGGLPALDQRLERDAVGAVVGLVAIGGEVHLGPLLPLADHGIGKAVLARRAEVRVEEVAAVGADVGDVGRRVGVERSRGDVLIPCRLIAGRGCVGGGVRGREDRARTEGGVGAARQALAVVLLLGDRRARCDQQEAERDHEQHLPRRATHARRVIGPGAARRTRPASEVGAAPRRGRRAARPWPAGGAP